METMPENLIRLQLRVPLALKDRLYAYASQDHRSANSAGVILLERALDQEEQECGSTA